MNKIKFRTRVRLLIVLTLLLAALSGYAVGKYKNTYAAGGGTVAVDVKLANSLAVLESKAVRKADGTYDLNTSETVTSNTYILVPGVDIPKDPRVVITGKTPVPAYLYVTVDCSNAALSYNLDNSWKQVGETKRYFYTENGTDPAQITGNNETIKIPILKNQTVYVSHELLTRANKTSPLTFTATLTEVLLH